VSEAAVGIDRACAFLRLPEADPKDSPEWLALGRIAPLAISNAAVATGSDDKGYGGAVAAASCASGEMPGGGLDVENASQDELHAPNGPDSNAPIALVLRNASYSWFSAADRAREQALESTLAAKSSRAAGSAAGATKPSGSEDMAKGLSQQQLIAKTASGKVYSSASRSLAGFSLSDLSVSIRKGEVVGVAGAVGSGKSSLLGALLGRMIRTNGGAELSGSIAYAAQEPWIFNGTVRENITFGKPYDESKFREVVKACALEADLEQLPAAELTEIGARGINLSGGQRARVALSRAVYSDADIVLLDDPLSAVDAHVGRHLWTECING